ncbi:hypothetical protein MHYP_G00205340 [Metynnis hypsauchen]
MSVFSSGPHDLGRTHLSSHSINTGNAPPIKQAPRRVPIHLQGEMQQEVQDMLNHGIIRPSHSPWAAPVVLVRKKDGSLRFCVDYRKLNEVTVKDAYPLPRIDDALDSLAAARWFSTLDLASGYWQVEINTEDKEKTAFVTRTGLYEFDVLPFSLCNAPSTFQHLMELVLADLQWTSCLIYLDDIIVFGRTFEEHLSQLQMVLRKLKEANLKVKPSKCQLFAKEVQYLGHIISQEGIMTDPAKVAAVKEWKVPQSQTEVRSFLGLASYYRRFVQDFATIARPLHKLTEKGAKMIWSAQCQNAFDELKKCLITTPILAFPDPEKPFLLDTDASDVGIGGVLSQIVDGKERVTAYASRALSKTERNYATTKRELLAVVMFMKQFRHYLLGRRFTLRTDHSSLRRLHSFDQPEGQIARWLEQLASFYYDIVHRPGKSHGNADALSRVFMPCDVRAVVGQVYEDLEGDWTRWDWRLEQEKDEQLQKVRNWVENHGPKPHEEVKKDPQLRGYWNMWSTLCVKNGVLWSQQRGVGSVDISERVVVPRKMVPELLQLLHNSKTGGHVGMAKLKDKIRIRFYWPGWSSDVVDWCRKCELCAVFKTSGAEPRAPLKPIQAGYPFEKVGIDIVGPLPVTSKVNKYIIVIADYFSTKGWKQIDQPSEGDRGELDSRHPPGLVDAEVPATWWVMQQPEVLAGAGSEMASLTRPAGGEGLTSLPRTEQATSSSAVQYELCGGGQQGGDLGQSVFDGHQLPTVEPVAPIVPCLRNALRPLRNLRTPSWQRDYVME